MLVRKTSPGKSNIQAVPLFVVAVVGIAVAAFAALPLEVLIRHLKDDSFYYMQTAQNIARGYGSTFDRINKTNGYHPLWMLNLLPIYGLLPTHPLAALRVVIAMAGLYHIASALLLFRLVNKLHAMAVAAAASLSWALSPVVLRINLSGMESSLYGLVLLGLATVITTHFKQADGSWRRVVTPRSATVAVVFGVLCVLARLDAALLLVGIAVALAVVSIQRRSPRPLGLALTIGVPAAVVLALYMLFNLQQFGTPLPVSGLIKRLQIAPSIEGVIAQLLWLVAPLVRRLGLWLVAGSIVLTGVVIAGAARWLPPVRVLLRTVFARYDWLWVGCGLLYCHISLSNTYIANWYYVPMFVLATLVFADLAVYVGTSIRSAGVRRVFGAGVVLLLIAGNTTLAATEFNPRKNDTLYETLRAATWMRDTLPEGAIGASWSAGVLAYFSGHQVVNLDGLINSYEYYQALGSGNAPNMVINQGVSYVFDMFPVPASGDTAAFSPDTAWTPFLRPLYEYRYQARNVGLSSLFANIFPQRERDALFMWKVWQVQ